MSIFWSGVTCIIGNYSNCFCRSIYFTDYGRSTVSVALQDGRYTKTLIREVNMNPADIVVSPDMGYVLLAHVFLDSRRRSKVASAMNFFKYGLVWLCLDHSTKSYKIGPFYWWNWVFLIHSFQWPLLCLFYRVMFWIDQNEVNPNIRSAWMTGDNMKKIVQQRLVLPSGITIDRYMGNRIYWTDSKHNTIESCKPDGSDRVIVKTIGNFCKCTDSSEAMFVSPIHS